MVKRLNLTQRRILLIAHLVFVAIWFGETMVYLLLTIGAAVTDNERVLDAFYTSMHYIAYKPGRASIIGTVITGILLSILTHWGLFKYKWIIVKEILTLFSMALGIIGIYYWTLQGFTMVSAEGMDIVNQDIFIINNFWLYTGIILQILSLLFMIIISVIKPWGKRK